MNYMTKLIGDIVNIVLTVFSGFVVISGLTNGTISETVEIEALLLSAIMIFSLTKYRLVTLALVMLPAYLICTGGLSLVVGVAFIMMNTHTIITMKTLTTIMYHKGLEFTKTNVMLVSCVSMLLGYILVFGVIGVMNIVCGISVSLGIPHLVGVIALHFIAICKIQANIIGNDINRKIRV